MTGWMDEDLGSESLPDPTEAGTTTTVRSVVEGFLRNDAGFPQADVAEYAGRALVNEARELGQEADMLVELAEWHESQRDADQEAPTEDLRAQAAAIRESMGELADLLQEVEASGAPVPEELRSNFEDALRSAGQEAAPRLEQGAGAVAPPQERMELDLAGAERDVEKALHEAYGGRSLGLRDRIDQGETSFTAQELAMMMGAFASPVVEAREGRLGRSAEVSRVIASAGAHLAEVSEHRAKQSGGTRRAPASGLRADFAKGYDGQHEGRQETRTPRAQQRRSMDPVRIVEPVDDFMAALEEAADRSAAERAERADAADGRARRSVEVQPATSSVEAVSTDTGRAHALGS